jgi:hypothetical protein
MTSIEHSSRGPWDKTQWVVGWAWETFKEKSHVPNTTQKFIGLGLGKLFCNQVMAWLPKYNMPQA